MTEEESRLRAQVLANPDDDAARLVYADWLVERGDPRGELIQLQLALAVRPVDYARVRPLQEREQELLKKHGAEWRAPFRECGVSVGFRRGFAETVIGRAHHVVRALPLFATEPICDLVLTADAKPGIRDLAAAPQLAQIRSLEVSAGERGNYSTASWALGDDGLAVLAACPYLTSLETFGLPYNAITAAGAHRLAAAPWLPQLTRLDICENAMGPDGIAALAEPPRLAKLRRLDLYRTETGSKGAAALAAAGMTALRWLRLTGEPQPREFHIGAEGAAALAASPSFDALEWFELAHNWIEDAGAAALARAPHMRNLVELILTSNLIGDQGAAAFATASERSTLVTLDLAHNLIGATGATALANSTSLAALERLDLRSNQLREAGIAAFAMGTGLPKLGQLGITHNGIYTDVYEEWTDWDGTVVGGGNTLESHAQTAARLAARPHLRIE